MIRKLIVATAAIALIAVAATHKKAEGAEITIQEVSCVEALMADNGLTPDSATRQQPGDLLAVRKLAGTKLALGHNENPEKLCERAQPVFGLLDAKDGLVRAAQGQQEVERQLKVAAQDELEQLKTPLYESAPLWFILALTFGAIILLYMLTKATIFFSRRRSPAGRGIAGRQKRIASLL